MPRIRRRASCPSTGRLDHFHIRPEYDSRIETGVEAGRRDLSLLRSDDRQARRAARRTANSPRTICARMCTSVEVWPVKTNAGFLDAAARSPRISRGRRRYRLHRAQLDTLPDRLAAEREPRDAATRAMRLLRSRAMSGDDRLARRCAASGSTPSRAVSVRFTVDGERARARDRCRDAVRLDRLRALGRAKATASSCSRTARPSPASRRAFGRSAAAAARPRDGAIVSPMPGKIIAVEVTAGRRGGQGPEAGHARGDEDGA